MCTLMNPRKNSRFMVLRPDIGCQYTNPKSTRYRSGKKIVPIRHTGPRSGTGAGGRRPETTCAQRMARRVSDVVANNPVKVCIPATGRDSYSDRGPRFRGGDES